MNGEVLHLFISPGHNFFGHHGQPAGQNPVQEVDELRCVAGRGIEGDRFFDFKADYRGQITFFEHEVYQAMREQLQVWDKSPGVFRRNVITRGLTLNALIGKEFELQGIRFLGVEECRPCHWLDQVFSPGVESALKGHGGLRAKILTDGILRPTVLKQTRAA